MAPVSQVKVWDPLVRFFHWALVSAFAVAFLTEDDFLRLHSWAGYIVLALVGVRLVWGLVGPTHARFPDFVRSPAVVFGYLKDVVRFRARRYLGHNPAGGAMIVLLLGFLALTGLSGLAVYGSQEFSGPLASLMQGLPVSWGDALEDLHEALANATLALVVLHLVGVVVASLQHRENLPKSMLTGFKQRAIE